jgi:hypothetical protein
VASSGDSGRRTEEEEEEEEKKKEKKKTRYNSDASGRQFLLSFIFLKNEDS